MKKSQLQEVIKLMTKEIINEMGLSSLSPLSQPQNQLDNSFVAQKQKTPNEINREKRKSREEIDKRIKDLKMRINNLRLQIQSTTKQLDAAKRKELPGLQDQLKMLGDEKNNIK